MVEGLALEYGNGLPKVWEEKTYLNVLEVVTGTDLKQAQRILVVCLPHAFIILWQALLNCPG